MINNQKISIVIPAYNEEDIIGCTLNNLTFSWIDQIIVVNDGSSDNTKNIIQKYKVELLDLKENCGKGNAINQGILETCGDIILIIDADLGESVVEIEKLIEPLIDREAKVEFTIAVLPIIGGGLGFVRKLADISLKYLIGENMRAPLSGQRAFKRDVLEKIYPLREGFGLEMGINIALFKNNIKFEEVDCEFQHRITKQSFSGYIHRSKQFLDIIKSIWEMKKSNYV
ncbi:glycosyltransferase family 2 protein [Natronospora cellulosivora (SeqCode)]